MSDDELTQVQRSDVDLVIRSGVPDGRPYDEYKQTLRRDFLYSCAYCTMSEAEAQAIRFTIDHYEPKSARPDLECVYSNLMYACDECNTRKGPRTVPEVARADGIRFFRPDQDQFADHFARQGLLLKGLTKLAEFTVDAVDLNRLSLRRIRELRIRLSNCEELVAAGIRGLSTFRIDQLPPHIRKRAQEAIQQLSDANDSMEAAIRKILHEYAKSALIDENPDGEQERQERLQRLRGTEALYPEASWRASSKK
ncbi:HNH endonuclease [Rhizobium sp. BR 362]|uniref:HNH endonuclease n=1 Tax=Rhizobium sp. BR 362 TaxID=3040670 RepID=UPI002F42EEA6